MPTSSQSRILSVVDYQLLQKQQQSDIHDGPTKSTVRISVNPPPGVLPKRRQHNEERRLSTESKTDEKIRSPPPPHVDARRRSSEKMSDAGFINIRKAQRHVRFIRHEHQFPSIRRGLPSARPSQHHDLLHMPIININDMTRGETRTTANLVNVNDHEQTVRQTRTAPMYERTKPTFMDSSRESVAKHRNAFNSDHDDQPEHEHRFQQTRPHPTPVINIEQNDSSISELDNTHISHNNDDDDDGEPKPDRQSNMLNENARRLLMLGTIRPSKMFYKNLPEADVNHLMNYFRRMKNTNQRATSEEINQELATNHVEYKPKIFFDSACVTKSQVTHVEKIIEPYADQIRTHQAELARLDNPMRFVIKPVGNDVPLATVPREYNDCLITLVTQTDPLRKSEFVSKLVQEKLLEDVKANSLDISYFPGGVNYDVPRDEIDENGQMTVETYQKLKKRLTNRKVWYFNGPPEKKSNALLAFLPSDSSIRIDHQRLLDALYDRIKSDSTNDNSPLDQRILSIEFVPLSCILNSNDIPNHFIINCDTIATKQQLMEKPLKIVANKQSAFIELQSHDENMQREYDKFIKSEKYKELIKNHDEGKKRILSTKK